MYECNGSGRKETLYLSDSSLGDMAVRKSPELRYLTVIVVLIAGTFYKTFLVRAVCFLIWSMLLRWLTESNSCNFENKLVINTWGSFNFFSFFQMAVSATRWIRSSFLLTDFIEGVMSNKSMHSLQEITHYLLKDNASRA